MLDASSVHPHGCVISRTDVRFNHWWCSEWCSAIPAKTHFLGISRTNQQEEHFFRRETWKVLFIRVERQLRQIRRRRNPKIFSWAWKVMLMVPRKIQQRDPIMMPECIHRRADEVLGSWNESGCRLGGISANYGNSGLSSARSLGWEHDKAASILKIT